MAASPMSEMIQYLGTTVLRRDGAGLSDGQLLGCFIEHRDDAAFAALVRPHREEMTRASGKRPVTVPGPNAQFSTCGAVATRHSATSMRVCGVKWGTESIC